MRVFKSTGATSVRADITGATIMLRTQATIRIANNYMRNALCLRATNKIARRTKVATMVRTISAQMIIAIITIKSVTAMRTAVKTTARPMLAKTSTAGSEIVAK